MVRSLRLRAEFPMTDRRPGARHARRFGAQVEWLERRVALATIAWSGNGDGTSFNQAANWVGNVVPGAGDDAVINVGGNTTVTVPTSGITVHSLQQTGGTLAVSSGAIGTATGLTLANCTLSVAAGATYVNTGTIQVNPGSGGGGTSTLSGNFTNEGTFTVAAGATLDIQNSAGQTFTQADGTLTAATSFSSQGLFDSQGGLFLVDGGTITGHVSTTGGSLEFANTITMPTTIYVDSGTTTLVSNDSPLATVLVEGGKGIFFDNPAYVDIAAGAQNLGTIILQPLGGFNPESDLIIAFGSNFVNTGTIQVDNFTVLNGNMTNQGTLDVNGAALVVSGTSFTNAPGGTINAYGTLDVSATAFINSGILSEGTGAGVLKIQGNYTQSATGVLDLVTGGTPSSTYDQLNITGSASLGGTLNESLIDGFAPVVSNSFKVITYAQVTGSFATFNGLPLPYGALLQLNQSPTDIILSVA
jgi:hypothetical protein